MQNNEPGKVWIEQRWKDRAPAASTRWLVILAAVFLVSAIFAGGYAYEQHMIASDLAAQNQSLHSTVDRMSNQIANLTEQLNQMATPPRAAHAPVNKMGRNHIYGYLIVPKYKDSQLTSSTAQAASDQISKHISTSSPSSSSYYTPIPSSIPTNSSQYKQSPSE